jgi:hypothetical protein
LVRLTAAPHSRKPRVMILLAKKNQCEPHRTQKKSASGAMVVPPRGPDWIPFSLGRLLPRAISSHPCPAPPPPTPAAHRLLPRLPPAAPALGLAAFLFPAILFAAAPSPLPWQPLQLPKWNRRSAACMHNRRSAHDVGAAHRAGFYLARCKTPPLLKYPLLSPHVALSNPATGPAAAAALRPQKLSTSTLPAPGTAAPLRPQKLSTLPAAGTAAPLIQQKLSTSTLPAPGTAASLSPQKLSTSTFPPRKV